MTANSQVEELRPNIVRLEALGCQLVGVNDHGAFGYVASFEREDVRFSIVKDRGYWHLTGEAEELKHFPSRKSRGMVERDAIVWLAKKAPNQPSQPTSLTRRG